LYVKVLAKTDKTSFNTSSFTENAIHIFTVKVFPFVNELITTLGILGALYINEVKTIESDVKNIPLTSCNSERKNTLDGVVFLIYDNLLSSCHDTEVTHRVLEVLRKSEEVEEFVSDVLNVAHVCLVPFVTDIIHEI